MGEVVAREATDLPDVTEDKVTPEVDVAAAEQEAEAPAAAPRTSSLERCASHLTTRGSRDWPKRVTSEAQL